MSSDRVSCGNLNPQIHQRISSISLENQRLPKLLPRFGDDGFRGGEVIAEGCELDGLHQQGMVAGDRGAGGHLEGHLMPACHLGDDVRQRWAGERGDAAGVEETFQVEHRPGGHIAYHAVVDEIDGEALLRAIAGQRVQPGDGRLAAFRQARLSALAADVGIQRRAKIRMEIRRLGRGTCSASGLRWRW